MVFKPKTLWAIMAAAVLVLVVGTACILSPAKRAAQVAAAIDLQPGDVLFQSSHGDLSLLIEAVSGSPYSHCGLVVQDKQGKLVVLEAIGPVLTTPLTAWIRRGRGQRLTACRLKPDYRKHIPALIAACRAYMGRPYDSRFRWDEERIYCSELIFKGWHQATGEAMGERVPLESMNWKPFAEQIEKLEGGPVPLKREMITPRDLARAPQLEVIYSNYTANH